MKTKYAIVLNNIKKPLAIVWQAKTKFKTTFDDLKKLNVRDQTTSVIKLGRVWGVFRSKKITLFP